MTRMLIVPDGWPCRLSACQPGHFIFKGQLCLKSEYHTDGMADAYCSSGKYFWGGVTTPEERGALMVQPVTMEVVTDDE